MAAGASAAVDVTVPTRLLATWADGWQYEPGTYRLRAGTSAVDLPLEIALEL
jgi:beta-glucosidase